jgi:hypothetical protein
LFEGKSMVMAARKTSLFKDDDMPKSSSLVSNRGGRVNFRGGFHGGRGFRGGRGDKRCDLCGKTNHTKPYCWVQNGKPNYLNQLSELVQLLRIALSSSSVVTLADSSNVAGIAHSSPSWVIDFGANKHISGILSLFSNLLPIKHHIVLADGSSRPVLGKGVLHPTSSLSLPSSLFVPDSLFNLLSVTQLTKALQCSITFDPTSCIFQDLRTKEMIGSGHEKDGLYYLDHDNSASHAFLASALSAIVSPL